jgi:hypothetical protein
MSNELWMVMMGCTKLSICIGRLGHHLKIIFRDKNQKMDKIYSSVNFANVILSDAVSFYQCQTPMMSTLLTLVSSP